jgi:hypothetical protein
MTVGILQARKVYRVLNQTGKWSAIFADDGSQVPRLDPKAAIQDIDCADVLQLVAADRGGMNGLITELMEGAPWASTSPRSSSPVMRY